MTGNEPQLILTRLWLTLHLLWSNVRYGCRSRWSCLRSGLALQKFLEYPLAKHYLGPVAGRRVLDVGAHYRYFAIWLASSGGKVVAADLDRKALGLYRRLPFIQRHPHRLVPCGADGHALPFADRTFDRVVCVSVIEHLRDDSRVMREVGRVLAPGGRAVISFPFAATPRLWRETEWNFTRAYSPETMRSRLVQPSGLMLERIDLWRARSTTWRRLGYLRGMVTSYAEFKRIPRPTDDLVPAPTNTAFLVLTKR